MLKTRDGDGAVFGFSQGFAFEGSFNGMVDRIANQVNDGRKHALAHRFVEFRRPRLNLQLYNLSGASSHTSNNQRHSLEELLHRHHSSTRDATAQIPELTRVLVDDDRQLTHVHTLLTQIVNHTTQTVPCHHEL